MDDTSDQGLDMRRATNITGERNKGLINPALITAIAAAAVGVNEMLSNGLTIGNAVGTAAGALTAYFVIDMTGASVVEAGMIGSVAGGLGVAIGNRIQGGKTIDLHPAFQALFDD